MIAVLVSVSAHVGLLFGFNQRERAATADEQKEESTTMPILAFEEPPPPEITKTSETVVDETQDQAASTHSLASLPEPVSSYTVGDLTQAFVPTLPVAPKPGLDETFSIPVHQNSAPPRSDRIQSFDISELDRVPKRLRTVAPVYPHALRRAGVEGDVELIVIIDPQGAVKVEKALGNPARELAAAATKAAEQCLFESPKRNGEAVHARYRMRVPFRITVAAR